SCGILLAALGPGVKVRKLYSQNCALKSVKARIQADPFVVVLFMGTVNPKGPKLIRKSLVISRNKTAVTHAAKVLRRIKAETSDPCDRSDALSVFVSANGLRSVFDDRDPVPLADLHQGFHIGALAV